MKNIAIDVRIVIIANNLSNEYPTNRMQKVIDNVELLLNMMRNKF